MTERRLWRRPGHRPRSVVFLAALALTVLAAAPAQGQLVADSGVVKSGPASATPGETITYTVNASYSTGIIPLSATPQVRDSFPAALSGCKWTCLPLTLFAFCGASSGSGDLDDSPTFTPIAPQQTLSVLYQITCDIDPGATVFVTNTATIVPDDTVLDFDSDNNSSTWLTLLFQKADLAITKTDGSATATPGGTIVYTIGVTNAGPSKASGAVVTDAFPSVLTGVKWTCTGTGSATCPASGSGDLSATVNVPVGDEVIFNVTATIDSTATGTLSNTAKVSAPSGGTDPVSSNNSATDSSTLVPEADLSITKTDSVSTVTPGEGVTYTIVVSNAGPSDSTGALVSDPFPAALENVTWTCVEAGGATCASAGAGSLADTVDLPSGGAVTYTVVATLSADATGTLTNTAVVAEGVVDDPVPGNNLATDTDTVVRKADLSLSKTDLSDPVLAGSTLLYRLTVANAGPSRASGAEVTDLLPTGVTFVSATGDAVCVAALDVATGRDRVTCSFATLAVGGQAVATVETAVAASVSGTIVNEAHVAAVLGDTDPVAGNDTATESTTAIGRADLSLTKTDAPDPVAAGSSLTYTLTVANAGPGAASGVVLTDTLPAGVTFTSAMPSQGSCAAAAGVITCTLGSIAKGSTSTATIVVAVGDATSGTLTNVATVTGSEPDPMAGNNTATAVTTVNPPTDLSVSKTDLVDPVAIGQNLPYVIEVRNRGPYGATSVRLTDTLPSGVSFVSAAATQGLCTGAGGVVDCSLGTLASGAMATVNLVVLVESSAPASLSNQATVSGAITDPDPSNNTATATTSVTRTADLTLTKAATPSPVGAGSTLRYTFTVVNHGPADAPGVVITDTLPAGTAFVAPAPPAGVLFVSGFETGDLSEWSDVATKAAALAPQAAGACSATGSTVTCALGTLAAGATATVSFDAEVLSTASGSLTNSATVSSDLTDPQPADDTASVTVSVSRRIDVGVTIADAPDPVSAGGLLAYTLTVSNAGPATATGVGVGDPLPAELTLLSATPSQGSCTQTQEVICDLGSLGPGASATVAIRTVVSGAASGAVTNAAAVVANETDLNPANDTDTVTTTISP